MPTTTTTNSRSRSPPSRTFASILKKSNSEKLLGLQPNQPPQQQQQVEPVDLKKEDLKKEATQKDLDSLKYLCNRLQMRQDEQQDRLEKMERFADALPEKIQKEIFVIMFASVLDEYKLAISDVDRKRIMETVPVAWEKALSEKVGIGRLHAFCHKHIMQLCKAKQIVEPTPLQHEQAVSASSQTAASCLIL
jgi:hypothetical protein